MLHASVAFLPSSSAMLLLTLAHAAWLAELVGRRNNNNSGGFPRAIWAVAGASILCWPFSCVGGVTLALGAIGHLGVIPFVARAAIAGIGCVLPAIAVDSYYYGRYVACRAAAATVAAAANAHTRPRLSAAQAGCSAAQHRAV